MKKESISIIYNLVLDDREDYYKDVNNVEDALQRLGYSVDTISIGDDIEGLLTGIKHLSPTGIFNLCEGVNGDSWGEVYIAGLLELLKIPYTGSGPVALAFSLDKAKTNDLLRSHNIKVPLYKIFNMGGDTFLKEIEFPLIIKPLYEDGSYGIDCDSVVYDESSLLNKAKEIHQRFREPAIVEEYIEGRELNISILGNKGNLQVLPISEIDYRDMPLDYPRICSYKAKWNRRSIEYKGTVPICPADISPRLRGRLEDIAVRVYQIMGCRDYGRIDIRLDKNEIPYIIDVNPNPCLSPDSGFVRSAKKAGFGYVDLVGEILNLCMERNGARRNQDTGVASGR